MKHVTFPRALSGSVFAAPRGGDDASTLNEISTAIRGFMDRSQTTIDNVVASMEAMQRQIETGTGISGSNAPLPVEPDYSRAFASYFRKGGSEPNLARSRASPGTNSISPHCTRSGSPKGCLPTRPVRCFRANPR